MTEQPRTYRRFHPIVADAYTAVHKWLEVTVKDAHGYKDLHYEDIKKNLKKTDWIDIASQYYAFFHTHYFKAAHTLESIIGTEQIITWLRHRQKVCVLDVGCGAGAGSAAFLETVIKLKEKGDLTNEVNILFIGIDPSFRAIGLYIKMMENLKSSCSDLVNIEFKHIVNGFPNATTEIERYLRSERSLSELPCLSNVLVMQLNVISPFSQTYRTHQENYDELRSLCIDIDGGSTEDNLGLGTSEALAYKQLIETVAIDVMHLVTVGTKNMEYQVKLGTNSKVTLAERIKEMMINLHQIVGNRHTIEQIHSDNHIVHFENPENCYWKDRERKRYHKRYHTDFYADFQTISSADRAEDKDWNEVISLDNLNLAWARARRNLLSESLYDETELRLFETNLDSNIAKLQEQLCAYASDVALVDQTISYKFPKNVEKTRPRGLSRIEEEILSVAIIQKLGDKSSQLRGSSYAYRISGKQQNTEYLYDYYFTAYRDYLKKARDSANNYPNGAILRVDIESFYTKIIQEQLCHELYRELTESERVRWLIRLLLSKTIDEHQLGQGITQGNIGSGFYANIYLTSVDAKFGSGNEWGVELHRYVDDMIFVIPNPEDMKIIENTVKDELQKLGLNLNENKTEKIYEVSSFLEQSDQDQRLDELSDRFDCVVNPLWIMNSEHRDIFKSYFHNDELWWHHIHHYQQCLREIKIYINDTDLSHKIYKYLYNNKSRERDLAKQKDVFGLEGELKYTQPPDDESFNAIRQWSASFITSNNVWSTNRDNLRKDLVKLFEDRWQELCELNGSHPNQTRTLERDIRFALYRLSILGLEDILNTLMEILRQAFWIIRNPLNVLENLAKQGYLAEIRSLLTHYQNIEQPVEYLKAVTIRAMRFLPKIYAKEWELIVKFGTSLESSVSIAEKLMATETWLYLGHKYNDFKQNDHIEAVKIALRSKPPERLQKNYLLILGQFEPKAVEEFQVNRNDPMLVTARNLALEGNRSDIFDLPEPKIIRQKYYSGQAPNDSDQEVY
ncbi:hypothetical protein BJP34_31270 [Moorena producens PAL-8-15-08-1]|uniref:Reverse transcriptase domain-containing protein n=1 Tax=Moorena producens PAL-8-15-08-1 TaxID=1458985 RepID=A0A1D8U0J6_9CYAN|nr:RNA-directed DNA polymerase [Moorena producens]AOX03324.1 hypothetical protein BJP34_31270 [Moorena producens PAL-8-15-08-1]